MKNYIEILTIVIYTGLLIGCASSLNQAENETLLPEIDVVQVKEYSEEALKLAQEVKMIKLIEELKRLINSYPASEYVPRAKKYLTEIRK
jgi:hypothetical protein